jgi:hypothetical protein
MRLTIQGALLFLFIPLVLFLYLRQPFGPAVSIVLGLAIMLGHRFVASPWMARHAAGRCLWCGRPGAFEDTLHVISAGRDQVVAACSSRHRDASARFLTFVARFRVPIAAAIFVPLAVLLIGSLAMAAGHSFIAHDWNTWQFKTIVALTVVLTSLAYRGVRSPAEPLVSPFPLHNFFLLGIRNTLWVFRLVGAWWIIAGAMQLFRP